VKERRYDIDWLRVVAMLGIFFLHTSHFFDTGGWHVKNVEQSFLVGALRGGVIDMWVLPLLFLLSGAGSWYSLRSRSSGQYLIERVKRLLVPLYIVGMFVLLPPQLYFELTTNAGFTGTFWEMFPVYWNHLVSSGFTLTDPFFFELFPGHLWFLQYLFLISLVILPLLLYLRSDKGEHLIKRVASWCEHRGGVFLFLIPLAIVRIAFTHLFRSEYYTWDDLLYYAVFFVIGYMMVADKRFTDAFKRHAWLSLALWIVSFAGVGVFLAALGYPYPGHVPFSLRYVLFQLIVSVGNWCAVVFMLSLGAKYLNFKSKTLTYSNEAVLPFYILHQTIILAVGWYVVRWNMGILPKFLIISALSFIIIMALYEGIVRHFNPVRFLFGMRPKKRQIEGKALGSA